MKKGWQTKNLCDVCDFEGGSQPPKSQFVYEEKRGYVRFLQIRDFGSDKNITYIPQAKKNRLCNESDILIGRYGASVGKILTDKAGAYNVALMKTLPNLAFLNRSWFYNYLVSDEFQLRLLNVADRSAQAGFSKDDIYNFPVPLPPLAEQQRIVGLLDEAFEGIATAKANAAKNLQNARALFESHLQSVFTQRGKGWVEKSLEQIGKTQTGSTPKTSDQSQYGDFISFVKPGDFNTDGTLDYDKDGLSESGAKGARKVPAGSVLMVCIGATIGKCGYCDQDVTTNQQINSLTPADGSSHRFLYYQMLTESFQRSVIHRSGQATLPIINKSKWSALSVWLPPTVAEQKRIAAKFDALVEETHHLATLYTRKLAALKALKKSLLHRAFSGEL